MIKDEARQERLNQVYRHLFAHFGINSQVQFAEAIHVQRSAISAAMNGNKAYLTKNLFIKVCAAFPGVFNIKYLLTGEGNLLTVDEEVKNEDMQKLFGSPQPDNSLVNKIIAAQDESIASLKREIKTKDELISALNRIIEDRDKRIQDLERQLAAANMSDIIYPTGVIDDSIQPNV
jgi:transcriptional regulator with XRE-family HTH domain